MTEGVVDSAEVRQRRYDRDFEAAVGEGCLTVQEAIRRGNRQAYAQQLSTRFQLPDELALRVADNKSRLIDALRAVGRIPGHPVPDRGTDTRVRWQLAAMALGLLTLSGLLGSHQWQRQQTVGRRLESFQLAAPRVATSVKRPAEAVAPPAVRTSVERDGLGRITRVSATSPGAVLAALCATTPSGACDRMEVYSSEPPFPGHRFGLLTLTQAEKHSHALPIRWDRRSGRWVAGTGLRPILSTQDIAATLRPEPCDSRDGSDCMTGVASAAGGDR